MVPHPILMLVLILGDCHGELDLVHHVCMEAQQRWGIGAAIQVGDFGFFPKVMHQFLHEGKRRFPVPLHVIDGNHEDHGWLKGALDPEAGMAGVWKQANLQVHARATTLELEGTTIGFLGGALHADRRQEWSGAADGRSSPGQRQMRRDPEWANWVTEGDCDRAIAAFSAEPPDLLVTHSCPAGIGIGIRGSPLLVPDVAQFITKAGFDSGPFTDCGEGVLTRLWHQLPRRPPVWVFGHFHQLHERVVGGTRFLCVGSSDRSDGVEGARPILYDTTTHQVQIHADLRLGIDHRS